MTLKSSRSMSQKLFINAAYVVIAFINNKCENVGMTFKDHSGGFGVVVPVVRTSTNLL